MPGFSSDRISGRKPNLNINLNTQLQLIILKHIHSKYEQLLIQSFNTPSFSTLIFFMYSSESGTRMFMLMILLLFNKVVIHESKSMIDNS